MFTKKWGKTFVLSRFWDTYWLGKEVLSLNVMTIHSLMGGEVLGDTTDRYTP